MSALNDWLQDLLLGPAVASLILMFWLLTVAGFCIGTFIKERQPDESSQNKMPPVFPPGGNQENEGVGIQDTPENDKNRD
jgi:hypothetical protein